MYRQPRYRLVNNETVEAEEYKVPKLLFELGGAGVFACEKRVACSRIEAHPTPITVDQWAQYQVFESRDYGIRPLRSDTRKDLKVSPLAALLCQYFTNRWLPILLYEVLEHWIYVYGPLGAAKSISG